MNVWLVTVGEPVPVGSAKGDRLQRTGMLASYLSEHGHSVVWWTSTFHHYRKQHLFPSERVVRFSESLEVRLLPGPGYMRNVSLARAWHHWQTARHFRRRIENVGKPDVIVVSLPTIELSVQSVRYGQRFQVPVVLDIRDLWPDIFTSLLPGCIRPAATIALLPLLLGARYACRHATAVIGITEAFVEWGLRKGKRLRSELDCAFPMAYDARPLPPGDRALAEEAWERRGLGRDDSKLTVCFLGTIGRHMDLLTVIEAARLLQVEGKPIRFVICGAGDRAEQYRVAAAGLGNVQFVGWVTAAEIQTLMERSDVGLDPMPDRYDFVGTINNKAVEYLSGGLAVIASPPRGVLAEFLAEHECGETYAPGAPEALARILAALVEDRRRLSVMKRNALRAFGLRFSRDVVCAAIAEHLLRTVEAYRQAKQC